MQLHIVGPFQVSTFKMRLDFQHLKFLIICIVEIYLDFGGCTIHPSIHLPNAVSHMLCQTQLFQTALVLFQCMDGWYTAVSKSNVFVPGKSILDSNKQANNTRNNPTPTSLLKVSLLILLLKPN